MTVAKPFSQQIREQFQGTMNRRAREMRTTDQSQPQMPEDKHGPGYSNDVAMDWRRGANGSAESKPNFDHSQARLGRAAAAQKAADRANYEDTSAKGPRPRVRVK
jgi:hypothetical protein